MNDEPTPPRRGLRPDIAKQVANAQLSIVEHALVAFVEDVLGRVPSDDEILSKGMHVNFADTPLASFEAEGKTFTKYYVWNREHVVAIGFLDPNSPLTLYIVRLKRDDWPVALSVYIKEFGESKEAQ